MNDRGERKYRRYSLVCPVYLESRSGGFATEVETVSENMSVCGLLVRSPSMIPHHTPVTFMIRIEGKETFHPIHLMGAGRIVRVESRGLGDGFATAIACETPIAQLEEHLPVGETGNFGNSC
jgi:hypothetical protein